MGDDFNKEEMVAAYIDAIKAGDADKTKELAASLPESMSDAERIGVVQEILDKAKEAGVSEEEVEALANTVKTLEMLKNLADQQDSTVEEAKDSSEVEETSKDEVADDSAAEAAEGDAPTEEEKSEKSEEEK